MKKVLISGSFDPPTLGHLFIIEKCASLSLDITVCVFVNPEKKYSFDLGKRIEMLEELCKRFKNVKVDSYSGMLYEYALEKRIDFIARGIRNEDDIDYELSMADFNCKKSGIPTVFFSSPDGIKEISSTKARKTIEEKGSLKGLVDESTERIINEY